MMGTKVRSYSPLPSGVSLEELVPEDHFYRVLEERLDLSCVRVLVAPLYAGGGRPSVFFKLQLVLFFEDLRSERRLMEVVADRLSLRWCLGYDLHEPLPDHSSLTRIRERYGLEIFGGFFERIVEMSAEAGLVWGEELFVNSNSSLRRSTPWPSGPAERRGSLRAARLARTSRLLLHDHYAPSFLFLALSALCAPKRDNPLSRKLACPASTSLSSARSRVSSATRR